MTYVSDNYTSYSAPSPLSQTTAQALRLLLKDDAQETAHFLDKFNKYFDMLNVTNYTTCYEKRKIFQEPYRWANDARLKVMNPLSINCITSVVNIVVRIRVPSLA